MISVIVPVYNVEKYVSRCINSILNQSYGDFEILLVDDGSTDSSSEICDAAGKQDQRIRVFHKENGGLSDARNYGLDRMQGEYVTFIDSDDYVGPDYLRVLYEMASGNHADLAVVKTHLVSDVEMYFADSADHRIRLNTERAVREMIVGSMFGVSACGKLYSSAVFREIRFPKGKLYEDLRTIPYVFAISDGCCYSSSVQYYYYQREDSIMHKLKDDSIEQWNRGIDVLYSFADQQYPEYKECVICRYLNFAFPTVINNLLDEKDYIKRIRAFQEPHRDWWETGHENPYLSAMEIFRVYAVNKSVRLYKYLYKMNLMKNQVRRFIEHERQK